MDWNNWEKKIILCVFLSLGNNTVQYALGINQRIRKRKEKRSGKERNRGVSKYEKLEGEQ